MCQNISRWVCVVMRNEFSEFLCLNAISCQFFLIFMWEAHRARYKTSILSSPTRWQWVQEEEELLVQRILGVCSFLAQNKGCEVTFLSPSPLSLHTLKWWGFWCLNNVLCQISFWRASLCLFSFLWAYCSSPWQKLFLLQRLVCRENSQACGSMDREK